MEVLSSMNLTISFNIDRKIEPLLLSLKKDIFAKKDGSTFLDMILNTDVGEKFNILNIRTIQKIETKLFKDFQTRHKFMDYNGLFQSKINQQDYFQKYRKIKGQIVHHYTESKKCKDQVHPAQIQDSFKHVLFKIVSNQLLGNDRNKKKILKHLHNLLMTARTESYSLLTLLKQIKISSITWLNLLDDKEKYILLAKFIKWLFQYFIVILIHNYYIAYIKEQRIFIHIEDFIRQESQHIKKLKTKFVIEVGEWDCDKNKNKLTLALKKNGLRPIVRNNCSDNEKQALRKALCILSYLHKIYLTNTNNNFTEKYTKIAKENHVSNDKLYIISIDIVNAYESIRIAKLYNIIEDLFKNLPDELVLQWKAVKNYKKYTYLDPETNPLRNQALSNKIEIIEKRDVLRTIKGSICDVEFAYRNKMYYMCKGVGQGLVLSPILCNIYYSSMRKKYFSNFEKHGFLFHYVDDSLYITKNRDYAELYLEKVKRGIPEYNCWFNESKLKTNFSETGDIIKFSTINYLGWNINCDSLEVEPIYESARYTITYTSLTYKSLRNKILNVNALKINKLILCKEINSEIKILNNVKVIMQHHAMQYFSWISYLWNDKDKFTVKTLQIVNRRLIRKIENYINWDKNKKTYYRNTLKYLIWKTFYTTFSKKPMMFYEETRMFKKLMGHYKKFLH